jgi:hypothetical protein
MRTAAMLLCGRLAASAAQHAARALAQQGWDCLLVWGVSNRAKQRSSWRLRCVFGAAPALAMSTAMAIAAAAEHAALRFCSPCEAQVCWLSFEADKLHSSWHGMLEARTKRTCSVGLRLVG